MEVGLNNSHKILNNRRAKLQGKDGEDGTHEKLQSDLVLVV